MDEISANLHATARNFLHKFGTIVKNENFSARSRHKMVDIGGTHGCIQSNKGSKSFIDYQSRIGTEILMSFLEIPLFWKQDNTYRPLLPGTAVLIASPPGVNIQDRGLA